MAKLQYGLVFTLNARASERAKVQKLQSRALSICFLATGYVSNLSLHRLSNGLPIGLRAQHDLMILMFKRTQRGQCESRPDRITRLSAGSAAYQGPTGWQLLPPGLRQIGELSHFKSR